ncbi:bifunctional DedA family/phosphatase PAP2 family protein [Pseudonocardia dioxanivorans]|nr:bifunctional DedA family/phosphatase PAP2 family protein [Pseudonocardia dioxanivorans]
MSDPMLPGVFGDLAPFLDSYGYLAVAALLFVEDFGVPAPGETILIAAAVYAGAGRLNLAAVVAVGVVAATAGDNVGFAIGHFGGRALVLRFGRHVGITDARLDRAERFFSRHGGKVVVAARFVEGLRQINGVVAGLANMPWRRFLVFNLLGAALWVGTWASIGYLAGDHLGTIYAQFHRYERYVLAALALVVAVLVTRRIRATARTSARRAMVLTATLLAAFFAALAVAVGTHWAPLIAIDTSMVTAGHAALLAHPGVAAAARVVTDLGSPVAVDVVTVVVCVVLAVRGRWVPVVALAVARLGELGCETLVKHLLARPRPSLEPALTTASGFSFPSGHAGGTAAVYGAIALLALGRPHSPPRGARGRGSPGKRIGTWAVVIAVVATTAVASSRVLLGVHYPSDVVAGVILGLAWALLACAVAAPLTAALTEGGRRLRRARAGTNDSGPTLSRSSFVVGPWWADETEHRQRVRGAIRSDQRAAAHPCPAAVG